VFACCLTSNLHAQIRPFPPPDTNDYDGGTNMPVDLGPIQAADLLDNYAPSGYSRHCDFGRWWPTTDRHCHANASHSRPPHSFNRTSPCAQDLANRPPSAICSSAKKFQFRQAWTDTNGNSYSSTTLTTMAARAVKVTFNIESATRQWVLKNFWPGCGVRVLV